MSTTRIEFSPGHEDEAITEQDVADKLRLMKAAPRLLLQLKFAVSVLERIPAIGGTAQVDAMRVDIAAAEGRSLQEQS